MTPEQRDALAGEYVLGTLSQADRAAVVRQRVDDTELDRAIRAWEMRFAPLAGRIEPIEPPPGVFARIAETLDREALVELPRGAAEGASIVVRLATRARRWRAVAVATGAIAASLAGVLVYERALRPNEAAGGQFIAVVNRDAQQPALIVRVDTRAGTVSVRSVATEQPADKSLELWYVAGGTAPKSLGLVPEGAGSAQQRLPVPRLATDAVFAVTVEPKGGSPTGGPTGPIVYSGKLIAE